MTNSVDLEALRVLLPQLRARANARHSGLRSETAELCAAVAAALPSLLSELEAARTSLAAKEARVERLTSAVRWALGYDDGDPQFEPRGPNDPPYWWRKELRARAGLEIEELEARLVRSMTTVPSPPDAPVDRHNAAILPVLRHIVSLIGREPSELLVFAASMVAALFMLIVRLGGDEPVLSVFMEDLSDRLAHARLDPITPEGEA